MHPLRSAGAPSCEHTNHFFAAPLCPTQSLIRRVMTLALHILTLGIPLLVYRLFMAPSSSFEKKVEPPPPPVVVQTVRVEAPQKSPPTEAETSLSTISPPPEVTSDDAERESAFVALEPAVQESPTVDSPPSELPIPESSGFPPTEAGREEKLSEMETALKVGKELSEDLGELYRFSTVTTGTRKEKIYDTASPTSSPQSPKGTTQRLYRFSTPICGATSTIQPKNPKINQLAELLLLGYTQLDFRLAEPHDPWKQDKIPQDATQLIQIAYTISIWMLEDLQPFAEGQNLTFAQILTDRHFYFSQAFFYLPLLYHELKGNLEELPPSVSSRKLIHLETHHIDAGAFYEEGTYQNSWRTLYNDFCTRLEKYVCRNDLPAVYNEWTLPDIKTASSS